LLCHQANGLFARPDFDQLLAQVFQHRPKRDQIRAVVIDK
jgi:hypothetical protein